MTRQLARRGLCRLDLLYRGAEPVAASIVLESAEALWLWRAAGAPGTRPRRRSHRRRGRRAGAPGRQAPDLRDVGHHAARESYTGSRVRRDGAGGGADLEFGAAQQAVCEPLNQGTLGPFALGPKRRVVSYFAQNSTRTKAKSSSA